VHSCTLLRVVHWSSNQRLVGSRASCKVVSAGLITKHCCFTQAALDLELPTRASKNPWVASNNMQFFFYGAEIRESGIAYLQFDCSVMKLIGCTPRLNKEQYLELHKDS
jgi:hypothetical protein